jgi:hypothetical protein
MIHGIKIKSKIKNPFSNSQKVKLACNLKKEQEDMDSQPTLALCNQSLNSKTLTQQKNSTLMLPFHG